MQKAADKKEMKEIHDAALAYYANLSEEGKQLAHKFFKEMDSTGKGKVSLREYADFFKQKGFQEITHPEFFKALDADGNGDLDFNEFLVVYYLYAGERLLFCKECRKFLSGLYFSCVQCFDSSSESYEICCDCYRTKKYDHHQDASFLDNFTLLRSKRNVDGFTDQRGVAGDDMSGTVRKGPFMERVITKLASPKLWMKGTKAVCSESNKSSSDGTVTSTATSALDIGEIGSTAADLCTVM